VKETIRVAIVGALLLAGSPSVADTPPTAVLSVRVLQLRSNDGQVGCMLYNSALGFPTDPSTAAQKRWCSIKDKTSTCSFDPVTAGTYAVACLHDENGNGKLDTGLFGIPKEGTVVSNHAKGFMGPPSFDKAKFAGVATTLDLRMGY
jgi:uncharacterized protein (DUF2141 family)